MSTEVETSPRSLSSLDGIRATFEARQRTSGKGFHALGDEVLSTYWQAGARVPKPVSAMTFRNFLQGKTTLRDPTGLELYFRALGAGDDEMRTIVGTLQRALDRRLAMPRTQAAQRAFDGLYWRACRTRARSWSARWSRGSKIRWLRRLTHLTPREYLLGPDGVEEASSDPERWGLLQHLDELTRIMARLDQRLTEGLEALPESDRTGRRAQSSADLREAAGSTRTGSRRVRALATSSSRAVASCCTAFSRRRSADWRSLAPSACAHRVRLRRTFGA